MDVPSENIIINSCQYTPVYFIENPSANQARSYIITPNNQSVEKPVSETLKRFYENSGKLETNLNGVENSPKPRILKKPECNVVGNNLKLASFLLPKSETKNESSKQVITPVNNVLLKPVYIANSLNPNPAPKLDVNSKIVKLKDLPNVIRSQNGKILPKIKPKENTTNKSKHTSVQLLKLGETYHSLNQLSDDQMKIVNHALNIFSNPQNSPPEPTYDPVTNTKFIYKVVSPKDLAVVGKNKINKHKKVEVKTDCVKIINNTTQETEVCDEQKIHVEAKVTRSGRIVKLPKTMIAEESPNKPKRKNGQIVSCLQCTSKFSSPHRLHRHYEHHPTHLPSKLHTDLFQCLLSIVKIGSVENGASIFIQQLDQFVKKLKSCIPCLLKSDNTNGTSSVINDDISRLLGINPGKYNLNIDALNCEKDKNGFCIHNPSPSVVQTNECINTKMDDTQTLKPKHDTILNIGNNISMDTVLSDKLPIYINNNDKRKHTLEGLIQVDSGKKMKLTPEIERDSVVIDDIVALLSDTEKTENSLESLNIDKVELKKDDHKVADNKVQDAVLQPVKTKPAHIQFRSTHFDIRSSPIKSSSTVFRKFQINPEKMAKYEVEIIRPIQLNKLAQEIDLCADKSQNEQVIIEETIKTPLNSTEQLTYKSPKEWSSDQTESFTKCNSLISDQSEDYLKSDTLIEPGLLHVKDGSEITNTATDNNEMETSDISINQGQSIINFLESLGNELTYSETAIRNNSIDFQLDLFSFNNS